MAFGTRSLPETILWVIRRLLSGRATKRPNVA
jgi:hypothetical protein